MTNTLTPTERIVRDALGATDAATYHGQSQDLDVRARDVVATLREQHATEAEAVLRALCEVRWTPNDEPSSFVVSGEDLTTSYDLVNFARHLVGLPPRALVPEVGSKLHTIGEVIRAGLGAVVDGADGDRGIVIDGLGGNEEPTGVRWASGADTAARSWPMTLVLLPAGVTPLSVVALLDRDEDRWTATRPGEDHWHLPMSTSACLSGLCSGSAWMRSKIEADYGPVREMTR